MRIAVVSSAALALSLLAAPAAQAVTFTATNGSPPYSGDFYDWDGSRDSGFQTALPPSVDGVYANPLGNPDGQVFGYVYPQQEGKFDLTNMKGLQFVWGSIDPSNVLSLFDTNGLLVQSWDGNFLQSLGFTPDGNHFSPSSNPLIRLDFGTGENGYLTFTTGQIAFEVGAFGAVPEPSTWALMILGIGAAGAVMRRRRQTVSVRYA